MDAGGGPLLPDSVLFEIFLYLDHADVLSVGLVCQQWRAVARDEFLWKELFYRYYRVSREVPRHPGAPRGCGRAGPGRAGEGPGGAGPAAIAAGSSWSGPRGSAPGSAPFSSALGRPGGGREPLAVVARGAARPARLCLCSGGAARRAGAGAGAAAGPLRWGRSGSIAGSAGGREAPR